MKFRSPISRSTAMMAPIRCPDSIVAATASSSTTSSPSSVRVKDLMKGARPKCASARRMSAWNRTISANTTYPTMLRMNQLTVLSCAQLDR